jgi:FkbM family methyltransferase
VDCGANVGCSVIWLANEFPGAEIVAVEPDLPNFQLLNYNVAHFDNIRTIRAALWSEETRVVISNPDAEPWAFRYRTYRNELASGRALIDTVTMDRLLANHSQSEGLSQKSI